MKRREVVNPCGGWKTLAQVSWTQSHRHLFLSFAFGSLIAAVVVIFLAFSFIVYLYKSYPAGVVGLLLLLIIKQSSQANYIQTLQQWWWWWCYRYITSELRQGCWILALNNAKHTEVENVLQGLIWTIVLMSYVNERKKFLLALSKNYRRTFWWTDTSSWIRGMLEK